MNQQQATVNTVAPLQNVANCMGAMERVMNAREHLPKIIGFYGYTGVGKSTAASYVAHRYRAYYIELKETWTRKAVLLAILADMGIKPARTLYEMSDQVAEQLALSRRPLIVDEFDYAVEKGYVNLFRDLYESSQTPLLIIGEEQLEANLRHHSTERFHNRILDWIPAQPASLEDARQLHRLYCLRTSISDDLLAEVARASKGQIRRIAVNLDRIEEFAVTQGLSAVGLHDWGTRSFFTGEAPRRGR